MSTREPEDMAIQERTFAYAVRVVKLHDALVRNICTSAWTLTRQLLRSGTSIGANVQEPQSAESRADFIHKMSIAQKEARESLYWLRLLLASEYISSQRISPLIEETNRIIAIITAILINTKRNRVRST